MAYLSESDRANIWAEFMRDRDEFFKNDTYGNMTKADLRAAVDALDAFLEDNKVAINNSIPQPARNALTSKQKARLLVFIIERRYRTGN